MCIVCFHNFLIIRILYFERFNNTFSVDLTPVFPYATFVLVRKLFFLSCLPSIDVFFYEME